jgi:hypothetical protein
MKRHFVPYSLLSVTGCFSCLHCNPWQLDTQGRLDASKRGNAEENDGNEHEKDEKKTSDECGREQLIACEDAAL